MTKELIRPYRYADVESLARTRMTVFIVSHQEAVVAGTPLPGGGLFQDARNRQQAFNERLQTPNSPAVSETLLMQDATAWAIYVLQKESSIWPGEELHWPKYFACLSAMAQVAVEQFYDCPDQVQLTRAA